MLFFLLSIKQNTSSQNNKYTQYQEIYYRTIVPYAWNANIIVLKFHHEMTGSYKEIDKNYS